jgi:hypothetical protein
MWVCAPANISGEYFYSSIFSFSSLLAVVHCTLLMHKNFRISLPWKSGRKNWKILYIHWVGAALSWKFFLGENRIFLLHDAMTKFRWQGKQTLMQQLMFVENLHGNWDERMYWSLWSIVIHFSVDCWNSKKIRRQQMANRYHSSIENHSLKKSFSACTLAFCKRGNLSQVSYCIWSAGMQPYYDQLKRKTIKETTKL